jgi:Fe-S cluster biosynthesis and repair protein YggX
VVHISLSIPGNFTPPDAISSLVVEMKSEETLGFPSGLFEHNNPHQVRQQVESATGMQLEKGKEYQWDIPLQISALAAPYDRGLYGRLFHKISATVEWRGWTGWIRAGKTLIAEKVRLCSFQIEHNKLTSFQAGLSHLRARDDECAQLRIYSQYSQ